jgi:hypothetical protein
MLIGGVDVCDAARRRTHFMNTMALFPVRNGGKPCICRSASEIAIFTKAQATYSRSAFLAMPGGVQ